MAAKQATVIDHISNGRHAINIVGGWNQDELDMFGATHAWITTRRYDMAAEWIEIMIGCGHARMSSTYEGKYYQVKKGALAPKPLQRPYPAIMNAGGSEQGQHFSAKYSDIAFIQFDKHDLDFAGQRSRNIDDSRARNMAAIWIWSFGYVVQRETEKEAKDFLHYYVHEKGDWVAADNLMRCSALVRSRSRIFRKLQAHFMAGWGAFPLGGDQRAGCGRVLRRWPRRESTARCCTGRCTKKAC